MGGCVNTKREYRSIVLDGMPGAGKTSAFASAVSELRDLVWMPESNVALSGLGSTCFDKESDWYIEAEHRRTQVASVASQAGRRVLRDRGFLGVLGYLYGTGDRVSFAKAVQEFGREGLLSATDHAQIILVVDVDSSLARRGLVARHQKWNQWFDREFLDRLDLFYRRLAPMLTAAEVEIVDTSSMRADEVTHLIMSKLTPSDSGAPADHTHHGAEYDVASPFQRLFNELGGHATLGRPMTELIRQGRVQLFELGALEVDDRGRPRVWGVENDGSR